MSRSCCVGQAARKLAGDGLSLLRLAEPKPFRVSLAASLAALCPRGLRAFEASPERRRCAAASSLSRLAGTGALESLPSQRASHDGLGGTLDTVLTNGAGGAHALVWSLDLRPAAGHSFTSLVDVTL